MCGLITTLEPNTRTAIDLLGIKANTVVSADRELVVLMPRRQEASGMPEHFLMGIANISSGDKNRISIHDLRGLSSMTLIITSIIISGDVQSDTVLSSLHLNVAVVEDLNFPVGWVRVL